MQKEGATLAAVADTLQVGTTTLKQLRRLQREIGDVAPRPRLNGPPSERTPKRLEDLRVLVSRDPDRFLHELAGA